MGTSHLDHLSPFRGSITLSRKYEFHLSCTDAPPPQKRGQEGRAERKEEKEG